jgi:mannan endo-1,4-beta-mannosidase
MTMSHTQNKTNCRSITVPVLFQPAFFALCLTMLTLTSTAQMYLSGRHLYSQNGEKVVLRGVNEMFIYAGDKSGYPIYPEIEKSGSNCVRIFWESTGSVQDLKNNIYNCVTRGRSIAMVTLNDAIGNINNLQKCLDYWKRAEVKQAMTDFKKWTLLNIANEAGDGNVTDATFKAKYKDAITQLRNAGYNHVLIIDATSYGQNWEQLKRCWSEIYNHDPQKKVMFSIHDYFTSGGNNLIYEMTEYVANNNMPFILGEGPQQVGYDCNTTHDYRYFMQRMQEKQIGWLAWSWGLVANSNCSSGRKYDITTNGYYNNFVSTWSRDVVYYNAYSIKNTSSRPASIYNANPFSTTARTGEQAEDIAAQKPFTIKNLNNPVIGALHFYVESATERTVNISILNISGQQVFTQVNSPINQTTNVTAPLPTGVYMLHVTSALHKEVVRLVVSD